MTVPRGARQSRLTRFSAARGAGISKVVAIMSMSIDGYVADTGDGVAEVFGWYFSGDVEVPTASTTHGMTFRVSEASAGHLKGLMGEIGAMLTGRRTFEVADGWGGQHPWDVPAFVVTHEVPSGWPRQESTVHFVTDGIEAAVARARSAAGSKSVGVHGAQVIRQCLELGLLDELHIDLAAVVLGDGIPLFDDLANVFSCALGGSRCSRSCGCDQREAFLRFFTFES